MFAFWTIDGATSLKTDACGINKTSGTQNVIKNQNLYPHVIILIALHPNKIGKNMIFQSPTLKTLKFTYSENATKFFKISTVDLSCVVPVKSTLQIIQNLVAFPEYLNFTDDVIYG